MSSILSETKDTAPEDTEKSVLLNEATPLFEAEASSAAIVNVSPDAVVSIPSPARNSKLPPNETAPAVEVSSVKLNDEFANIVLETEPVSPVPISVPVATGKVNTAELPAECGCACKVCA